MPEEAEIPPFPAALQQQLQVMRGDIMPERWMCVAARREKINYAVGRIIQVGKVIANLFNISEKSTDEIGMKQKQNAMDSLT
jgi:hypothetical protein